MFNIKNLYLYKLGSFFFFDLILYKNEDVFYF